MREVTITRQAGSVQADEDGVRLVQSGVSRDIRISPWADI